MKKILLTVSILTSSLSFAQSFTPDVIGSAGTFATSASGSMSWTIGEVFTETYSFAGNFFTQGFHQPDTSFVISVIDNPQQNIFIYPNPVVDNLNIDLAGASSTHSLYIYDMQGQKVYEVPANNSTLQGGGQTINISFRNLANGIYLLNIINAESHIKSSYKINKTE